MHYLAQANRKSFFNDLSQVGWDTLCTASFSKCLKLSAPICTQQRTQVSACLLESCGKTRKLLCSALNAEITTPDLWWVAVLATRIKIENETLKIGWSLLVSLENMRHKTFEAFFVSIPQDRFEKVWMFVHVLWPSGLFSAHSIWYLIWGDPKESWRPCQLSRAAVSSLNSALFASALRFTMAYWRTFRHSRISDERMARTSFFAIIGWFVPVTSSIVFET